MKIWRIAVPAMAACLICVGCGRKIDASSKEKFNASIEALEKSMSAEEVLEFRRCCAVILFDSLAEGKEAYKVLDGMTFQDVKAKAQVIIEQHEKREKENDQE